MTHASVEREVSGNDRCKAGKATLTIERSSEAMNPPRAVTANRRAGRPCSRSSVGGFVAYISVSTCTDEPRLQTQQAGSAVALGLAGEPRLRARQSGSAIALGLAP